MDYDFDDIEDLKRNPDIESKGVELEIPGGRFLYLRAASDANPLWKAQADKISAEINRLRNARASNERVREFFSRKFSTLVIKDWKGIKNKGAEIEYSPEAGYALLMVAEDIYDIVYAFVWETKNFRAERALAVVEQIKN